MTEPAYRSAYLSRSLVAYIGNKRSLLPFLGSAFARCAEALEHAGGSTTGATGSAPRLLDPFAGSGGVSRLARAMGFRVLSNDREVYAATIARCRLLLDPATLETVFSAEGGSVKAFSAVNAFAGGASAEAASAPLASAEARTAWREAFAAAERAEPYIARHYAPADTEAADWRTERLFYTTENAIWLDRAREAVERRFAGEGAAKDALVDALIYEAATRTNTSGVFKACHRGFGGHGGDALDRIKSTMRLTPPDLVYGSEAEVGCMDAADFCAKRPAEIAYLDPPYNQHQYGSNYHLLTTVARWDKPPVSDARAEDGFLLDRSGIRSDWLATRSDFCRRGRATPAFGRLLDSIDARFILVSYNDGGIVPLDELADLLSRYGELRVESRPYVAYRGGKQSALRMERTSELLFVVERRPHGHKVDAARSEPVRETLRRIDLTGRLDALLRGRFHPDRAARAFASWPGRAPLSVSADGRATLLLTEPSSLDGQLSDFVTRLETCACASAVEAFDLTLAAFESAAVRPTGKPKEAARLRSLLRDALAFLRKLAFKKYSMDYRPRSARLRETLLRLSAADAVGRGLATSQRLLGSLDRLDAQAGRRGV